MWWPAACRFGLAFIATVACWRGNGAESETLANRASGPRDLSASYRCTIEDAGHRYPPFPCVIERDGSGGYRLEKLAGSQRIRGTVREGGDGLVFDGELYCPFGDCTQELHGVFRPAGNGTLRGTFRDAAMVVVLVPATGEGTGQTYGGAGYGGAAYGGVGYGGAGKDGRNPRP